MQADPSDMVARDEFNKALMTSMEVLNFAQNLINWQVNNWAFGCDFRGRDFRAEIISGEFCGARCVELKDCTHFTWTMYNGGTCWMKTGRVTKNDAFFTNDLTMVCGIVREDKEQGSQMITRSEFNNAVTRNGYPMPSEGQYLSFVTQIQTAGGITTKREAAMFLAQILWESDGLRAKVEYACKAGCPGVYDTGLWPKSSGNSYHGRGYIQLSWDYNYLAFSKAMFGDDRLLRDPEPVATDENLSWASAFWYWKMNVGHLNRVRRGHFGASTNAINGALECRGAHQNKARKRFNIYKIVLKEFNLNETPDETGCYN